MNNILTYAFYQFKVNSRYKANNIFSVLSTFVAIGVQYYIWTYIENNEQINANIISVYVLFALTFAMFLPIFPTADFIASKIIKGEIINFLNRPQSLFFITFGIQMGNVAYRLLYRVLPVWILFLLFFKGSFVQWEMPHSILVIIISVILSWLLAFLIGYTIGLLSTVLLNIAGLKNLISGLLLFFGGSLLPIDLYPNIMQQYVIYSPFAAISYYPVALMSGIHSFDPTFSIMMQLFWLVVVGIMLINTYHFAKSKMVIMGG